ncbi:hypothetical protein KC19_12G034700 [Ceratodon purpureus]|uniref:RING-type domain-containing protein n=1 Tax=Ceratodon purpureus TaxID=3225 RepID=A0A8T0G3S5_CERPU|nr:hypothetical protein KC19_12G034700 [Ceratodon purpureus]
MDIDKSSATLNKLEDLKANYVILSEKLVTDLCIVLHGDKEKSWETRLLNVIWKFSHCISKDELVLCLNKVAQHYTPELPEIKSQENFLLTSPERESLLSCGGEASSYSIDFSVAIQDEASHYDEKVKSWTEKENAARHNSTIPISKLADAFTIDLPIAARNNTAKECLHRLDLARAMGPDLNPHKSDTLASVMSTIMLPEEQILKALQNEMELYLPAFIQVIELDFSHREAYKVMKTEQLEKLDKFFQTCQKQKEDVIKEALYKKAKIFASIENASISGDVKLSSEDFLKKMLHKAGGALKKAEDKQNVESLERERNNECAICYSKFSMKRKRACLDPCGHANACFGCASKAWKRQPNCPWCKTVVEKPIPLPPTLYL